MDTKYIEEFMVLAKITNYGQAADALFTSQSTLFSHIKSLERELGVSLFERVGNKIELSDFGSIFIPYAKTIIDLLSDYGQAIQNTADDETKTVRIGTHYHIVNLVQQFKLAHKEYRLQLHNNSNSLDTLINGDCDLTFIRNLQKKDEQLDSVHYLTDHVVIALYDTHPLAKRSSVSMSELKNEEFIITKAQFDLVFPMCKEAGFMPKISVIATTIRDAAMFVNDRLGICLFYKEIIKAENMENLVMVDLDPPVECEISLLWKKGAELSSAAKAFIEFTKNARSSDTK